MRVASLHGSHVLALWSQLPLCVACVCQQCSFDHLFPWLECLGTIIRAASMRCVRWQCSCNRLLAWLSCAATTVAVISLHCLCVVAVPSQLPSPMARMCRHYNRSCLLALQVCFCVACVCWQCCPSRHHALLAWVKEASDSPGACLAASRNGVSWVCPCYCTGWTFCVQDA